MSSPRSTENNRTPAQVAAMEYEGYLDSDRLDPAWIAGWHAAINHVTHRLAQTFPPGSGRSDG